MLADLLDCSLIFLPALKELYFMLLCSSQTYTMVLYVFDVFGNTFLQVIGVPATIDGDLKNQFVETDVGFDTTCKVTLDPWKCLLQLNTFQKKAEKKMFGRVIYNHMLVNWYQCGLFT